MQGFTVFPREAFFIGLCIGEYNTVDRERCCFFEILKSRLGYLLPSNPVSESSAYVDEADLPPTLSWWQAGPLRVSHEGNRAFECYGDGPVVQTTYLRSDQTLFVDFLALRLRPHACHPLTEEYDVLLVTDPDDAARRRYYWNLSWHLNRLDEPQKSDLLQELKELAGTEDFEQVNSIVGSLVSNSEHDDLFQAGVRCGCVLALLQEIPLSSDDLGAAAKSQVAEAVDALLQSPFVDATHYAKTAFAELVRGPRHAISRDQAIMYFWLGVGELLGILRDLDEVEQLRWAQVGVSRDYTIPSNATVDFVRMQLKQVISNVQQSDHEQVPELSIQGLSPAIEALTRAIWPNRSMRLLQLFDLHLKPSSPHYEKRFASIAKSLYLSYRNPSVHEAGQVQFSVQEARFFISGIATLLDLHDQIRNRNKSKSRN